MSYLRSIFSDLSQVCIPNGGEKLREIPPKLPQTIQVYVMNRYEHVVVQISKGGDCFGPVKSQ